MTWELWRNGTVERRALVIWRARETQFPRFVRRMRPDGFDRVSGAWDLMVATVTESDSRSPVQREPSLARDP